MSWEDRIVLDPNILLGKPVIKGTRLSVGFIRGLLEQRWSREELLESYPNICDEDINAVIESVLDLD